MNMSACGFIREISDVYRNLMCWRIKIYEPRHVISNNKAFWQYVLILKKICRRHKKNEHYPEYIEF